MSQAEHQEDPDVGDGRDSPSNTFTLHVVSPSAGVGSPLTFLELPFETTVKQLKERIRNSLPIRPSDDDQRLIYRGRLLSGEDETMLAIFGIETIKVSGPQTLHLVLKPPISQATPAQNVTNLPQQQAGPLPPRPFAFPPPPQFFHPVLPPPPPPPQATGGSDEQAGPNHQGHAHHHDAQLAHTMQAIQQHHARLHQQHFNQQYLVPGIPGGLPHQNSVPSTAAVNSFQSVVAQHQRDRAALGMNGAQNQAAHQSSNATPNTGRPGQPQIPQNRVLHRPPYTVTRTHEVNAPDGQRWTVTVNETSSYTFNPGGLPLPPRTTPDSLRGVEDMVQNIVRAVENNANVMQNLPLQQETSLATNPGSSTNTNGAADQPASAPPTSTSTSAHPITNSVHAAPEHVVPVTNSSSNAPTLDGSMVYILSSPNGPRGLLVSPSEDGPEVFYVPQRQIPWDHAHQVQQPPQNPIQAQHEPTMGLPEVRNRREGRHNHVHQHENLHGEAAARHAPGIAHPGNPQAGAAAAQMWPHIWLVVRLLGFVWFFTSGSNSWWRLLMFSAVAFVIFIASTGVLNGPMEQVWGPVRRHLENLLPLAAPHPPVLLPPDQAPGAAGEVAAAAVAPPDPAQTAARLLEQRRMANENWFWTQFRRLEHATLLFVASLVPGVGERHIAARVAEENLLLEAQRQRREAEAAAAEETARATGGAQESGGAALTTGTNTDTTGVNTPTTGTEENGGVSDQRRNVAPTSAGSSGAGDAVVQPLIEV